MLLFRHRSRVGPTRPGEEIQAAIAAWKPELAGRLLERRSNASPRGMIA